MPEATASVIDSDGWLHTGDLAIMDERGYCKIVGRIKDMIIRGGENIYQGRLKNCYTHLKLRMCRLWECPMLHLEKRFMQELFL